MSVDILSWAAGLALTEAAARIRSHLSGSDLERAMRLEFRGWADTLDPARSLHSDALFLVTEEEHDPKSRPCLSALRQGLQADSIPEVSVWHDALVEQWYEVREAYGDEAQAFFLLPEEEASAELSELAHRLRRVCVRNEEFFKQHVVAQLRDLAVHMKPNGSRFPDAASPTGENAAKDLAARIEQDTPWRVHVVLIEEGARTLTVWGTLPGDVSATPAVFLRAACVASAIPGIDTLKIGLSGMDNLAGSNATGSVGDLLVLFDSESVYQVAKTKELQPAFWDGVMIDQLIDPNSTEQQWIRSSFREVERHL